jgi:CheY-like chemotaxis protein
MNGGITVRSRVGCGSIFTAVVHLPVTQAPAGAEPRDAVPSTDQPLTILIVDDVATNRLVLSTMLAKHNVSVVQAESGLEALSTMEMRSDIDAVFMDVQMPGMDGMEAARRIRRLEAGRAQSETPIIAVTANVLTSQIADYREAGMQLHIAKPIDPRRLSGALEMLRRGEPKRQAG